MNSRRFPFVVFTFFCIQLTPQTRCFASDSTETTPDALKFKYEVQRVEIEKSLIELKKLYLSQLDKLLTSMQSAGELDKAIAVKAEQAILAGTIPKSKPSDFESLKRLRRIYNKEKAKRSLEIQQKLIPLLTSYEQILNSSKVSLTKKGRLPEAKEVASRQDVVTAEIAALKLSIEKLKSGSTEPETGQVKLPASVLKGLLLHYDFDKEPQGGIIQDAGPNARQAKVEGATWTASGKNGSCFTFDGQKARLQIIQALPDMKDMTVAAWIRYRAPNGHQGMVFCDYDGKNGNDVMFGLTDRSTVYLRADKGKGRNLRDSIELRNELTENWHHLLWTLSPSRSTVYINGERVGSVTNAGSNIGFHNAYIGYGNDEKSWTAFNGDIDDFMIWERDLSASEVRVLYLSTQ